MTYAAKIRKEDAVLDWTHSALDLSRRVRAFNPWPVAETRWRDQQLRIWGAAALALATPSAAPGEVIEARDGRIVVATGDGALRLDTLQLPGRKPTGAAEFLRANPMQGSRLGQSEG
jgi:methionyl-tRNA formyltransferase